MGLISLAHRKNANEIEFTPTYTLLKRRPVEYSTTAVKLNQHRSGLVLSQKMLLRKMLRIPNVIRAIEVKDLDSVP